MMPFYIVICKPLKTLLRNNVDNPSKRELLTDVRQCQKTYVATSLIEAYGLATLFFKAPTHEDRYGSYGLVAEVTITIASIPEFTTCDYSQLYNRQKREKDDEIQPVKMPISHTTIEAKQIRSILKTYIPESAKTYNTNLMDTDFTNPTYQNQIVDCQTM